MRKLTETQRAALVAIADAGGTADILALKANTGAGGVTRRVLADRGYVESRFPGRISITSAGRTALASTKGEDRG